MGDDIAAQTPTGDFSKQWPEPQPLQFHNLARRAADCRQVPDGSAHQSADRCGSRFAGGGVEADAVDSVSVSSLTAATSADHPGRQGSHTNHRAPAE